jgi:hypothetical protein
VPSSASKSSSQTICIVGGSASTAATPATASKQSRCDAIASLPRHITKELFAAQCPGVAVSSAALGGLGC